MDRWVYLFTYTLIHFDVSLFGTPIVCALKPDLIAISDIHLRDVALSSDFCSISLLMRWAPIFEMPRIKNTNIHLIWR